MPRFHMIARDITRDCLLFPALVTALLAMTMATIARADSRAVARPSWPLAAPCDAEQRVRQRIEQQDPAVWTLIRADIRLDEHDRGYRLTLDTERDGVQGTRVFEAPRCADVVDAAVLLLSLMLDEARSEEIPPPPPPPLPPPAPPPPPPAPAPVERRVRASLKAAALGELGYLPRAGGGLEAALGLAVNASRIELTGLWLPDVRSGRGSDGARVAIGLWAMRLGYCHRLVGSRLALFGCAGLELGRAHGEGLDLTDERDRAFLWSAGHAGLRAALALGGGLALLLEPAVAVPFARRRFVSIDASGSPSEGLHTPATVSGRVAIALEAVF
ncbi:MAG TPA: hypothetical protein VFX59_27810 [Polyangiales bacterium]|nr:hypothetical protein [Polyangiales bacterium]